MPKKRLIRSKVSPYHVTLRCNNRERFYAPLAEVWRLFTEQCFETILLFGVEIHALVLMPNHIHLLLSTPNEDLGIVMQRLIMNFTKRLNRLTGRSGRVFGSEYHWTIVDSAQYFATVLKYVYRNPVRGGLCEKVEEYPHSTLQGLMGNAHLPFPLFYPFKRDRFIFIPEGPEAHLEWLNRPFNKETEMFVRAGLKRSRFAPPKMGWKRTLSQLSTDLFDTPSIKKVPGTVA